MREFKDSVSEIGSQDKTEQPEPLQPAQATATPELEK